MAAGELWSDQDESEGERRDSDAEVGPREHTIRGAGTDASGELTRALPGWAAELEVDSSKRNKDNWSWLDAGAWRQLESHSRRYRSALDSFERDLPVEIRADATRVAALRREALLFMYLKDGYRDSDLQRDVLPDVERSFWGTGDTDVESAGSRRWRILAWQGVKRAVDFKHSTFLNYETGQKVVAENIGGVISKMHETLVQQMCAEAECERDCGLPRHSLVGRRLTSEQRAIWGLHLVERDYKNTLNHWDAAKGPLYSVLFTRAHGLWESLLDSSDTKTVTSTSLNAEKRDDPGTALINSIRSAQIDQSDAALARVESQAGPESAAVDLLHGGLQNERLDGITENEDVADRLIVALANDLQRQLAAVVRGGWLDIPEGFVVLRDQTLTARGIADLDSTIRTYVSAYGAVGRVNREVFRKYRLPGMRARMILGNWVESARPESAVIVQTVHDALVDQVITEDQMPCILGYLKSPRAHLRPGNVTHGTETAVGESLLRFVRFAGLLDADSFGALRDSCLAVAADADRALHTMVCEPGQLFALIESAPSAFRRVRITPRHIKWTHDGAGRRMTWTFAPHCDDLVRHLRNEAFVRTPRDWLAWAAAVYRGDFFTSHRLGDDMLLLDDLTAVLSAFEAGEW